MRSSVVILYYFVTFVAFVGTVIGQEIMGDSECVIASRDACKWVAENIGYEFVLGDEDPTNAWGCYINGDGKATFDAAGETNQYATIPVQTLGVNRLRLFGDNSNDPEFRAAQNHCYGLNFRGRFGCVVRTWNDCEAVAEKLNLNFLGNAGMNGDAWGCFINKNGGVRFDGSADANGSVEYETIVVEGAGGRKRLFCDQWDLEELWKIPDPTLDVQGLAVTINYDLHDGIDIAQASYEVYDPQCVEGGVVLTTGFIKDPITGGFTDFTQVPVTVDIDTIDDPSVPESVYSEFYTPEGEKMLRIQYCIYFLLESPDGSIEVNWIESIISVVYDLNAGVALETNMRPKDRSNEEATKTYTLEAYLCLPGTGTPLGSAATTTSFSQGELITVCVKPGVDAIADGLEMKSIDSFYWNRAAGDNVEAQPEIIQAAVEQGESATNFLTTYNNASCDGNWYCEFGSILYASFYVTPGEVTGSGYATMQFAALRKSRGLLLDGATPYHYHSGQRRLEEKFPGSEIDLSLAVGSAGYGQEYKLTSAGNVASGEGALFFGWIMSIMAILLVS